MRKNIIIVYSLVIIVSSLIFISCACLPWWSLSYYVDNNTNIVEKIIVPVIIEGDIPVFTELKIKEAQNS